MIRLIPNLVTGNYWNSKKKRCHIETIVATLINPTAPLETKSKQVNAIMATLAILVWDICGMREKPIRNQFHSSVKALPQPSNYPHENIESTVWKPSTPLPKQGYKYNTKTINAGWHQQCRMNGWWHKRFVLCRCLRPTGNGTTIK